MLRVDSEHVHDITWSIMTLISACYGTSVVHLDWLSRKVCLEAANCNNGEFQCYWTLSVKPIVIWIFIGMNVSIFESLHDFIWYRFMMFHVHICSHMFTYVHICPLLLRGQVGWILCSYGSWTTSRASSNGLFAEVSTIDFGHSRHMDRAMIVMRRI